MGNQFLIKRRVVTPATCSTTTSRFAVNWCTTAASPWRTVSNTTRLHAGPERLDRAILQGLERMSSRSVTPKVRRVLLHHAHMHPGTVQGQKKGP